MTNLPQWAADAATTPRLTRYAKGLPNGDTMRVVAETNDDLFVGTVKKIGRSRYEWEAWDRAVPKAIVGTEPKEVVKTGRAHTLLAAIGMVHFRYAEHRAKIDEAKTPKRKPRKAKAAPETEDA